MKQLRKLATLFLVAALVIGTFFIPEQASAAKYNYPDLKQNIIRLKVGQSKTIKLKYSKGLKAKFYSNDTYIATVSKDGKIKAKREGETKILVVIDGEWRRECRVYVDPAPIAKKTMYHKTGDWHYQTHIDVVRTVEDAPFEITISTESEDENLDITVYEATSGNRMEEVGKITPDAKKFTMTATKKLILISATYDVELEIKVKTKNGKKIIEKVDVSGVIVDLQF